MRSLVSMSSFNAVAAGQTATLDLAARDVFHVLYIYYTPGAQPTAAVQATMEADIGEIRIKVNGKVQRRYTAAQLIALNAFYGHAFTAGYLPIFFSEPHRRSVQGEDMLGWGMADVSTFQVEIDIAAGAVSPRLSAKALTERGERPLGGIKKVRSFVVPVSAVGIVNLTTLPKTDAYYALHCVSTDVVDVDVRVDAVEIFKATKADADLLYTHMGLSPQAGLFTVCFDATRRVADALPMRYTNGRQVSDFRVDLNMGAANSFTLLTEVLGPAD